MIRNNNSRFSRAPVQTKPRSRFKRPYNYKTTFNAGQIIPIYCSEVLPGDSVNVDTAFVCRMSTPIFPVLDSAYIDTYFFFVPNRLIWDHWKEFCGENNSTYWTQPTEYNVPFVSAPEGGWKKGSLADYFGMPTCVDNISVSSLYFRAYVKIFNDYFRDQNSMNPATFFTDDSDRVGKNATVIGTDGNPLPAPDAALRTAFYGGSPLYASKFHDYFTSALPSTQKGAAAGVTVEGNNIPVVAKDLTVPNPGSYPLRFQSLDDNSETLIDNPGFIDTKIWQDGEGAPSYLGLPIDYSTKWITDAGNTSDTLVPSNLWADGSNAGFSILINDLRTAFAIQAMLETDARSGTRYQELLYSHFGTVGMDATLQRAEFLGGDRTPINMSQVLQTSQTGDVSPQGNASGFSMTQRRFHGFTKSFTEHGIVIGVAVVRTNQTYQQGLNSMFSRRRKYDYYWPALANISEQPILRKELVATGTEYDDKPFGYQEAWASYRYQPSVVTGAFRSNYAQSLDAWHYAEVFDDDTSNLVISSDFLWQGQNAVDRTLAVSSDLEDQFLFEAQFNADWTRVMPLYSVPVTLGRV